MSAARAAVVDLGSNSVRLFLCEGVDDIGPRGERITTVTALRRGALADGTVSDDALERLEGCLETYRRRVAAFVPDEVVVVGTSAVRDAPNANAIAELVSRYLDTDLHVLTGGEEAELSYLGARLAVPTDDTVLVMDIGGGSTELVRGDGSGPKAAVSMDVGAVRCTEAHLHSDPPTARERAGLEREVRELAAPVIEAIGGPAPLIGVAGTMTTLAAVAAGVYDSRKVHGAVLSAVAIVEMVERLAALPLEERRAVPGLHPDRAPAVVAGGCIASAVMAAGRIDEVTISERDLLDGVALRLTSVGR